MTAAQGVTLCELFQRTAARRHAASALAAAERDGLTWREYAGRVEHLTSGLLALGLAPGDTLALLTSNIPEFHLVDTAAMHARLVPFSLQPGDPVNALADRAGVASARVIATETRYLDRARALAASVPSVRYVLVVDSRHDQVGTESTLVGLERLGACSHDPELFRRSWTSVIGEDVATLIFTSGTTGRPKAVQLPHRAITVSLQSFLRIAPGGADGRVLCYLPLSHIAERFMSHYLSIAYGAEITCVRDPERLYDEITRVRPTRFFGVPRVYAKLADRARAILAASPDIDVGPRLGLDQAHYRGVATAPSSHAMLEFFQSIGLPVGDIWGLSEAIMCTATPAGRMKPGTVGRLLDGVEARLADDGEILVRGPNTFLGYAGDPERTAQIRDADGWVHTGDLGAIDSERYLTIAGRKKDMLITATGRNVAPATVEAVIREASPLIDQVVAVGDSRRFITVLIALDAGELSAFAERRGLGGAYAELARHPTVMAEIEHAVQAGNARLDRAERVRSWHVADSEWRAGGDEITPTMKVRRDEILRKYAADIEQMYVASAES